MATTPQTLEDLTTKLSRTELEKLAVALYAYLDDDEATLTDEQWDELDDRNAALDRGEGIVVDDVDAFFDSLSK